MQSKAETTSKKSNSGQLYKTEDDWVNFEITHLAFDRDVRNMTVGVFPARGRYFRQLMETNDGIFFQTNISIPKGISFYHLFINDDFEQPLHDVPGVISDMDPFKRIPINLESDIFCPVLFDNNIGFNENVGYEIKAISLHDSIDQLSVVDEHMHEYPMRLSYAFKHKKFWVARVKEKFERFAFKIKNFNRTVYLHSNNCYYEKLNLSDLYINSARKIPSSKIEPNEIGYQIFPDRFNISKDSRLKPYFMPWGSCPDFYSRFGGNIKGIIEKLDYLSDLGIGFIYLNPIFKAINSHGYDVVDYKCINPDLGTMADVNALVSAAHKRSIKVILDIPLNHCSTDFFAFKDVLEKQEDSKYIDWFEIDRFPVKVEDDPVYSCWSGYKDYPQFNFNNHELRNYLNEVSEFWVTNFEIDGWRLDSSSEIPYEFIDEFVAHSKRFNDNLFIVAENWHDDRDVLNYGVNGITNYNVYWHVVIDFFIKKKKVTRLAHNLMDHYHKYSVTNQAYLWNFLSNHDIPRFYSLVESQEDYELAFWLLFSLPGVPVIYYGEEIRMTGEQDPDNRKGMWWNNLSKNDNFLINLKFLISLRKVYKDIFAYGELVVPHVSESHQLMVLSRKTNEQALHFVFNFSDKKQILPLSQFTLSGEVVNVSEGRAVIRDAILKKRSTIVLKESFG